MTQPQKGVCFCGQKTNKLDSTELVFIAVKSKNLNINKEESIFKTHLRKYYFL